jgi:hypothetical protein
MGERSPQLESQSSADAIDKIKQTNQQNMKTNLYFCQKGKFAGYWRRIPFNYDYLKLAKRGHYTIQTID